VLSVNDCEKVVSKRTATFFGEVFPSLSENGAEAGDFAVLRFDAAETDAKWRPGYYRLDSDLRELNDVLRDLKL